MRTRVSLLLVVAACGDPAAHVQLAPVPLPGGCGVTTAKTALRVIAYTPGGRSSARCHRTDIDAFPDDTEQLGVEVIGGSGGELLSIGKTAPLESVDLFFFLSGFVLTHVYGRRLTEQQSWRTIRNFSGRGFAAFIRRAFLPLPYLYCRILLGNLPFPADASFMKHWLPHCSCCSPVVGRHRHQ